MKYKITTAMLLLFGCMASTVCAQVAQKVGNNPYAINSSAALEVESTTKGFLLPRMNTEQRDAIQNPVAGLNIYNITTNCVEWYNGTDWFNACQGGAGNTNDPSSNGTAVVISYNCAKASAGTLLTGTEVSGVTQTIEAVVSIAGTYSIAAIANGVTFFGSGTFANTGPQDIVLTASGTPTSVGSAAFTINTTPNCSFNRTTYDASSNGTAVVSTYNCAGASAGTMTKGTTVSGVTQTIEANVTTVGTYSISTTANGVTFEGSGTFAGTGPQNIVLTASGVPTSAGVNSFALNTNPNCNFSRATLDSSSNGTAVVSTYNCATSSAGTMTAGTTVSGVTQTITANVTTAGTYSIATTTANGVTFSGSGTFANTGNQSIVLMASGIPSGGGSSTFTLNTTPDCNFSRTTANNGPSGGNAICNGTRPTDVVTIISSTGKIWMDRNLGASRAATSVTDHEAYGCLYQWGRGNDGHASITWTSATAGTAVNGTTTILSATDSPGNALFILDNVDWRSPQNDLLWQGVSGVNNPCPSGYRVPSSTEFDNEVSVYGLTNSSSSYSSTPHKFVIAGIRDVGSGSLNPGTYSNYWCSSVSGTNAFRRYFNSGTGSTALPRTYGHSVRCIKE